MFETSVNALYSAFVDNQMTSDSLRTDLAFEDRMAARQANAELRKSEFYAAVRAKTSRR